ncbi:MAG: hypothetical protein ACRC62_13980 [Microcoleus sp.]
MGQKTERTFDSPLVRRTCEKIYGSRVSPDAWTRWKGWAKVKGKKYSFEQFCFMVAIAQCRHENRFAELSMKKLKAIAYSDATIQMIGSLVAYLDNEGWAMGWDILTALAAEGVDVDGATLKRVIPGMRPNCWYQVNDVLSILNAASRSA